MSKARRLDPVEPTGRSDVILPRDDPVHRTDVRLGQEPTDLLPVVHPPLATRMS